MACAGNPPAWWNPGNRYGHAQTATPHSSASRSSTVVQEETLPILDNFYEEEYLEPLPEEESAVNQIESEISSKMLPVPSVLE